MQNLFKKLEKIIKYIEDKHILDSDDRVQIKIIIDSILKC